MNNFYQKDGYMVGVDSKGREFYFDKEDLNVIKTATWYLDAKGYARCVLDKEYFKMHRFLLNISDPKIQIDHINNVKWDNRRCNLRICNNSKNKANCRAYNNNKSGFKGVSWVRRDKKWRAQIQINGVKKNLGYFDNKVDAAKTYNAAARLLFGEFAYPNEIQ